MSVSFQIEYVLYNQKLLKEMSTLYSENYGFWGKTSGRHGKRIKLSEKQISQWISYENTYIATARKENKLVGYAIAVVASKNKKEQNDKSKMISWVTQLVVHESYRQQGIAKTLLFSFWGFSNYYAWGILSSNPYAIRALESATKRLSKPLIIKQRRNKLITFGKDYINYINEQTQFVISKSTSKANTHFPSDISNVHKKLADVNSNNREWLMGAIDEGWEWFAFTFNDQDRRSLSKQEINDLLTSSDEIAKNAYSRMLMDDKGHSWSSHASKEVEFIIENCKLELNQTILDFGCGMGRHTIELAKKSYNVTGVDYVDVLLKKAQEKSKSLELKNNFIEGDCRTINLGKQYDVVLCLYDVIGSFIENKENKKILDNIYKHTKKEGLVLISVMNYELTKKIKKYEFNFDNEPDKVFDIPASNTMEKTGNIFNPDYFILDDSTHIVYRKEQFTSGKNLPTELIVRDRRYTKDEIVFMCKEVGFKILFSQYVQAGKWDVELSPEDDKAKEILVLCKKTN